LYAVLDGEVAVRFGWTLDALAEACLAGGARLVQVRAKRISGRELLALTDRIVGEAARVGARVIVNDRPDIASLAGAWGVHLGQDDLPPAAARVVMGTTAVVGLSTHTTAQVEAARLEPIDYLAVGPVFETATKDTGYASVGLDLVRAAAASAAMPVVAIGGITLDRATDVVRAGAAAVAVITDLFTGGDPESRTRAFVARLGE
jgi:thiamine-phosphate pyrophosphorylase